MDNHDKPAAPRLGIIISMFPEMHETFILRELVALEKRGVDFDIYSLQHPRDPITLDDAMRLTKERTYYSSLFNLKTLGAFFKTLVRHPIRVCAAIAKVIYIGRDRPMQALKNLAILPLTLHFGYHGWDRGIRHWHGHWSNIPTTACWYLQKIHGDSWSAAIHGEDIFSPNQFLRHKLDDASFTVVCSGYFCNHLKTQIGLESPDSVHLNYHGLDPRVMNHVPSRQFRARSADEPLSIISIGRLVPTKGHDVLIKACAKLIKQGHKLNVKLIGSGPDEETLKSLAESEGLTSHINFMGAVAFDDVLDNLMRADLFCLAPRLIPGRAPDGIPNVIAEAMALRIPVVTTRVSAIPELVKNGETGRLVEVDDVDAFAEAIAELAENPEIAKSLSDAAALQVADLFNQNKNIDELLALFAEHAPVALPDATVTVSKAA